MLLQDKSTSPVSLYNEDLLAIRIGECESDTMESCVEYKLSGDINSIATGDTSLAAWPFILCMEEADGNPLQGQNCYESTMNTTAVPWSTIADCISYETDLVQNAAADATPAHDCKLSFFFLFSIFTSLTKLCILLDVPWALVDGALVEKTHLLQYYICQAYTGPPPRSCTHATVLVPEKPERFCDNNGN